MKRYTDVAALKAGIQHHAFSNGVQINMGENISDIERFRQVIPKQKRPIAKNISEAPPPKRARIADTVAINGALSAIAINDARKIIKAMQRSCRNKDSAASVELKRIEAEVEIKRIEAELKRIEAEVEIKRMDVEKDKIETMRMELLMQDKITFEQYLQMK